MKGLAVGFCLVLAAALFAFTLGGGKLAALFHPSVIVVTFSFIVGSVVLAFGIVKPMHTIRDAFREPEDGYGESSMTNARICECAARSALYGAVISGFVELVMALFSIAGDVSQIGERIAASTVAVILGATLCSVVFQPLKRRFLALQNQSIQRRPPESTKDMVTDFLILAVAIAVSIVLLVAYLMKTSAYLGDVLRR